MLEKFWDLKTRPALAQQAEEIRPLGRRLSDLGSFQEGVENLPHTFNDLELTVDKRLDRLGEQSLQEVMNAELTGRETRQIFDVGEVLGFEDPPRTQSPGQEAVALHQDETKDIEERLNQQICQLRQQIGQLKEPLLQLARQQN